MCFNEQRLRTQTPEHVHHSEAPSEVVVSLVALDELTPDVLLSLLLSPLLKQVLHFALKHSGPGSHDP